VETCKGLGDIFFFAVQATRRFSFGMNIQPSSHGLAKALLHGFPGILVSLQDCTEEQFSTIPITEKNSSMVVIDLIYALVCQFRNAHGTQCESL